MWGLCAGKRCGILSWLRCRLVGRLRFHRDPYQLRGQPSCCRSTGQSPDYANWRLEFAKPKQAKQMAALTTLSIYYSPSWLLISIIFRYTTKTPMHLSVKSETRIVNTVRCRIRIEWRRTKALGIRNKAQETATDCGYVGLHAIVLTVGLFVNKHIALNYEWSITGNYAVRMHTSLKH